MKFSSRKFSLNKSFRELGYVGKKSRLGKISEASLEFLRSDEPVLIFFTYIWSWNLSTFRETNFLKLHTHPRENLIKRDDVGRLRWLNLIKPHADRLKWFNTMFMTRCHGVFVTKQAIKQQRSRGDFVNWKQPYGSTASLFQASGRYCWEKQIQLFWDTPELLNFMRNFYFINIWNIHIL